jgi:hypothetical protein
MPNNENVFCNKCGVTTPHNLSTVVERSESSDNPREPWHAIVSHQVLICPVCFCDTYRERVWFSENQDCDPDVGPSYDDTYYPPRKKRLLPKWHDTLFSPLHEVLHEVYIAFQHDLRYVAAIGCRTALDIATVDKVSDVGTFADKLKLLVSGNHISEDECELFLAVTDSGNAAAHRGFKPENEDLMTLIDIVERLIHKFYIKPVEDQELLESARRTRAKVPPRKKT